jgi:hypothetical protein
MAKIWNNFGALPAAVVALYPSTVLADYDETNPDAVLEDALARAADRIVNSFPERLYKAIAQPELVYAVTRASSGQAAFNVPFGTALAGTVHVWVGYPAELAYPKPRMEYEVRVGPPGRVELPVDSWSIDYLTGVVSLSAAMDSQQQALMSYETDISAEAFNIDTLARLAARGAAAEVGARLFSEGSQEWLLVTKYAEGFDADLKALHEGRLVPEEVRRLRFWAEIAPSGGQGAQAGSVRFGRSR